MNRSLRILCAVLAALIMLTVVCSSVLLVLTADHCCAGTLCPVCAVRIAGRMIVRVVCALCLWFGAMHLLHARVPTSCPRRTEFDPVFLKVRLLN